MLPATSGLAIQIGAMFIYAQLSSSTPLWLVVATYVVGAVGSGRFFPANTPPVMKAAPGESLGVTSGLLRTFANIGMVFSFAVAILDCLAEHPAHEAFAIFVGTTSLPRSSAGAFTTGLHAAFYASSR